MNKPLNFVAITSQKSKIKEALICLPESGWIITFF